MVRFRTFSTSVTGSRRDAGTRRGRGLRAASGAGRRRGPGVLSRPDRRGPRPGRAARRAPRGAGARSRVLPSGVPHLAHGRRGAGAGRPRAGAAGHHRPSRPRDAGAAAVGAGRRVVPRRRRRPRRRGGAGVAARASGLGYTLICGPELEFYLCEQAADGRWQRYANDPGNVYVVGRKGDPQGLLLHMLRQLRDAGLRVTAANHEFSPGQFEINLGHSELADAADRSFRLKCAVQEIARHRGLLATFMAKPFNDEGGSGFHVHLSVADATGGNAFGDPDGPDGLSQLGRHAIGGVLGHARALSALLNPTINSFKRFGPDTLAPWLIDWGLDNRSAMVRIPPERGAAARMEVRLGDATANPYLAMAAVGAAVCLGIQDKAEPPPKLEGYGYDPARAEILPARLGAALDALEADRELIDVLGEYFVTSFLAYKRNEIERFERFVTDWEFREYAYHL